MKRLTLVLLALLLQMNVANAAAPLLQLKSGGCETVVSADSDGLGFIFTDIYNTLYTNSASQVYYRILAYKAVNNASSGSPYYWPADLSLVYRSGRWEAADDHDVWAWMRGQAMPAGRYIIHVQQFRDGAFTAYALWQYDFDPSRVPLGTIVAQNNAQVFVGVIIAACGVAAYLSVFGRVRREVGI